MLINNPRQTDRLVSPRHGNR